MISPAQIEALEAAAKSWEGTPFCEGSPVKGAGCACQHCPMEILFDANLTPRVHIPNGPSNWAGQTESLIAKWMNESGLFQLVERPLQPADVLGFYIGHTIHHGGLVLQSGRMIHAILGHKMSISPNIPQRWEKRLACIWRLKTLL